MPPEPREATGQPSGSTSRPGASARSGSVSLSRTPRCTRSCWLNCHSHADASSSAGRSRTTCGPRSRWKFKYGSKIHLITERTGLPLSVGISDAHVHDSQALILLVKGIPPVRSRRGPRRRRPGKLHADKGYDYRHLRHWLAQRAIQHRIARKGIETSQRLGRHRWTIERTMAGLPAAADSTAVTNARPITFSPSRASPAPSSASAGSTLGEAARALRRWRLRSGGRRLSAASIQRPVPAASALPMFRRQHSRRPRTRRPPS